MAIKLFIVEQITNWNQRGEKKGTHRVQMDEGDIAAYVAELDGKINVFEQNLTLSVESSTATASLNVVDFIKIKHNVLKPIYIANSNKRPIIFKTGVLGVTNLLSAIKPFDAPYSSDLPTDVSIDTGNMALL